LSRAGSIGRTVQITAADEFAAGLLPIVNAIRATGATTLDAITRALTDRGVRSARGATWHVSSVSNLLARSQRLAETR